LPHGVHAHTPSLAVIEVRRCATEGAFEVCVEGLALLEGVHETIAEAVEEEDVENIEPVSY